MKLNKLFFVLLPIILPSTASAAFVAYTSAGAWITDVGPTTATEDFTSFTSDTEFRSSAVSLAGGMTIRAFNETLSNFNFIDESLDTARARIDSGVIVRIDFTTPVSAWGSNLSSFASTSDGISVFDANNNLLGNIGGSSTINIFRGFNLTAGESAAYLIFDALGSDVFDINDMSVVSAVPVPAAIWLFGSGLIGLIGIARRKKL